MLKKLRWFRVVLFLAIGAVLADPAAVLAHNGKNGLHCERKTVPVQLAPGGTAYSMAGWLCTDGNAAGESLQVLLPGLTYDHTYWDFPYQGNKYSYVRHAVKAGFATFAVDRIGTGQSSRPPANEVTFPAQAYATVQLVEALRQGSVSGHTFKKIVGVGHSMGAGIWMLAVAQQPKLVDGLVLVDYLHQANPVVQAALGAARYPAEEDPAFVNAGLPEGYITTRPGTRSLYYETSYADPRVIHADEKLKQTTTTGEIATIGVPRDPQYSRAIKVPTLLVVGEKDSLFCDEATPGMSCRGATAIRTREAQHYAAEAKLEVIAVPRAGHDTNLHYQASKWFRAANTWVESVVY